MGTQRPADKSDSTLDSLEAAPSAVGPFPVQRFQARRRLRDTLLDNRLRVEPCSLGVEWKVCDQVVQLSGQVRQRFLDAELDESVCPAHESAGRLVHFVADWKALVQFVALKYEL